ncbi:MAG TPA: hypothetical protein VGL13_01940 [Polyangiaceae bacterium]|jgi:hypothetical protein
MPWKETDSMKERVQFVLEWEKRWNEGEGRLNLAALCRAFGISRQVGYMWLERYRKPARPLGPIKERTRRPMEALGAPLVSNRHVVLVSEELGDCLLTNEIFPGNADFVAGVHARKLHPTWGEELTAG